MHSNLFSSLFESKISIAGVVVVVTLVVAVVVLQMKSS